MAIVTFAALAGLPLQASAAGTPPNPPTNVSATSGAGQVTLQWAAPFFANGSISGYSVTPWVGAVAQPVRSFASSSTSQAITGLTNGTSYTFTVRATNEFGTGEASSPSPAITVGAPGSPAFPSAAPGDGQAQVRWLAPTANASAITGYSVTPWIGTTAQPTRTFASTATTQAISGLTNGTAYTFSVAATNASGTGVAATTAVVTVGAPVAPAAPSATPGDARATVSWKAPTAINGSAVTGYVVTPSANGTKLTPVKFASTATTQVLTGLANGVSHTFTVAATNARGTGPASGASPAVVVGAPTAPTGVSAAPRDSAAVVSWTAPAANGSAITGYTVVPYLGTTAQTARVFTSTATSQTITGLTNGSAMTFRVTAKNARGTGPASSASPSVTIGSVGTAPAAPARPTAVAGIASATVSWSAPATNGSPISAYEVVPWRNGVALAATSFPGTATSGTVRNILDGDVVTFTVRAQNGIGWGPASAASLSLVVGTPQPPTSVVASSGTGQVTLRWSAPFFANGTITGYVITPWVGGTAQPPRAFASTATTQVVSGLTNGASMTFTVAATNAVGTGTASTASTALVVGAPAAPAFPSATPGDGTAAVRWWAAQPNASAVTGYVVTPTVDGVVQPAVTFSSTATAQTLTGLTNGGKATFAIAATNAFGTGVANRSGTVVIGSPIAPTGATSVPGAAAATVSWTAPTASNGSPVTGYVVTPSAGGTALAARTFNATATTQTVTGLIDGTSYTFTVAAMNARGTGPASAASAAGIVGSPTAPTSVVAVTGAGQASVTWQAPADNGSPVTGYAITPYVGTTALATRTYPSAATTQVVTGLTNGSATSFQVAATNARGTGPRSPASAPITVGVPTTPASPTATAALSSARVTWDPPAANGGAITSYEITPWREGRPLDSITVAADQADAVVSGLRDGVSHTFTIAARNAFGSSLASSASAPVVPGGVPSAPAVPVVSGGSGSVTLTWAAPAANGAAITGYEVTPWIGTEPATPRSFPTDAAGTPQVLTGLGDGTSLTFTVRAANSLGTGPSSEPSDVVIVGAPSAPDGPSAALVGTVARLGWTVPSDNGAAVTGYVVTPWIEGVARPDRAVATSATTIDVSLLAGEHTAFTVSAVNPRGRGPESPSTMVLLAGTPGAPVAPRASTTPDGMATLSWAAPATNGGAITGYVVTPWIGSVAQRAFSFGTSTTQTLSGLGTGVTYRFTVAAVNATGTGPASPPSDPFAVAHWLCLPAPPTTAADVEAALNHHDRRWQGGDGARAVALPDGRILWLFGDTIVGTVGADGALTTGWGMVHGSALVQDGSCLDPFYSSTDTRTVSLVPNAADGSYYWPGDAWTSADGLTLQVMVSHVRTVGTAVEGIDTGIAVFRLPDLRFVHIDVLPAPPSPPPATGLAWRGLAYHDTADHHVYLSDVEGFDHYLVRIPDDASDFTTTRDWEYWDGSAWSLRAKDVRPVSVSGGTYAGLSVQKTSTGYIAAASGVGADAGYAIAWSAPTPAGPWTPLGRVAATPGAGGNSTTYAAHPQLLPGMDPLIVWSRSAIASGSTAGAGIAVAPLAVP